jgi:hypothetical protein
VEPDEILEIIIAWGRLYLTSDNEPDKLKIGLGILAQLDDLELGQWQPNGYYTMHYVRQF